MQCSIVERDCNGGIVNMKTDSGYKNPYKKESNLDNIVDQLCTRLQDIKDQKDAASIGMPTCSIEQTEAVRRYYAAFPALKKGQESPLQYYLPPPAWCRKTAPDNTKVKMQSDISMSKDWNSKNKKYSSGRERRNSYHGQKKNRKRYNSYSRSFESKEILPEWMTHEGVWDIETQDPVKEFIRAIALDEGYGTCENTVTEEVRVTTEAKLGPKENMVPDWDDGLDLEAEWAIADDWNPRVRSPIEPELFAKFEAKFDSSLEALWSKDQNTPDDEYQDLPIDFQDLLASPSDHLFADPSAEKRSFLALGEGIWGAEPAPAPAASLAPAPATLPVPPPRTESPTLIAAGLHDRLRPLHIADAEPVGGACDVETFALYESDELYDVLAAVADTMRSFAAINHSREGSGFAEVVPRRRRVPPPLPPPAPAPPALPAPPFAAAVARARPPSRRALFRPIRREGDSSAPRYRDGDTFDISGELDTVEFLRSESGGAYLGDTLERYLEYRGAKGIDYGRLNLTAEQRCPDLEDPGFRLRFPLRQRDVGAQTDAADAWACDECGGSAKKKRPNGVESIWSAGESCACGAGGSGSGGRGAPAPPPDELSRDWEELLADISAAHRLYAGEAEAGADRKRRHSAALRCAPPCSHPHARFLRCCSAALHRPLTR